MIYLVIYLVQSHRRVLSISEPAYAHGIAIVALWLLRDPIDCHIYLWQIGCLAV